MQVIYTMYIFKNPAIKAVVMVIHCVIWGGCGSVSGQSWLVLYSPNLLLGILLDFKDKFIPRGSGTD